MDKETIVVRVNQKRNIDDIIVDLVKNGVECRPKFLTNSILTKNIIIKCIIANTKPEIYKKTRGLRCTGCFGFDNETTDYITKGGDVCKGYTLETYVKEINEIGY